MTREKILPGFLHISVGADDHIGPSASPPLFGRRGGACPSRWYAVSFLCRSADLLRAPWLPLGEAVCGAKRRPERVYTLSVSLRLPALPKGEPRHCARLKPSPCGEGGAKRRKRRRPKAFEMLRVFEPKRGSISKRTTLLLISPLRGQLPLKGKPAGGASPSPTLRLRTYFFTLHYSLLLQPAPPHGIPGDAACGPMWSSAPTNVFRICMGTYRFVIAPCAGGAEPLPYVTTK